jgi:hypothetical protein
MGAERLEEISIVDAAGQCYDAIALQGLGRRMWSTICIVTSFILSKRFSEPSDHNDNCHVAM